jgi:hypothetical protein
MLACSAEHLIGGQVPTFDSKHQAGAGPGWFPSDLEVSAFQASRRSLESVGRSFVAHCLFLRGSSDFR